MDEGEEVVSATVVAGGEASEVLELVEASLNLVSELVGGLVVRDRLLA